MNEQVTEDESRNLPTLVPLQVSQMDFHGDSLTVVLVEVHGERQVLVPLRQFCQYLGIEWSSQLQRTKRDDILAHEMMSVLLTNTLTPTRGQRQSYPTLCLPLDLLPGWLFNLSPNRVKPQYRERVQHYRGLCYRALWQAFLRGELFPREEEGLVIASSVETTLIPSNVSSIYTLDEQIETLSAIVASLKAHRQVLLDEAGQVMSLIEAGQQEVLRRTDHISDQLTYVSSLLEQLIGRQNTTEAQVARIDARTQRLSPAHARSVQGLVEKIVRASEIRNLPGHRLLHAYVYGRLKTRFRSGKFDEIADERYLEVEAYLHDLLRQIMDGKEPTQESLF